MALRVIFPPFDAEDKGGNFGAHSSKMRREMQQKCARREGIGANADFDGGPTPLEAVLLPPLCLETRNWTKSLPSPHGL